MSRTIATFACALLLACACSYEAPSPGASFDPGAADGGDVGASQQELIFGRTIDSCATASVRCPSTHDLVIDANGAEDSCFCRPSPFGRCIDTWTEVRCPTGYSHETGWGRDVCDPQCGSGSGSTY